MSELTPEQRETLAEAVEKAHRCIVCRGTDPQHVTWKLAPVVAQMLADEGERIAQGIDSKRAEARTAFRQHNAGRDLSTKPPRRPDLDSWANAFEVAARIARGQR
jgi:hypothetical protein